MEETEVFREIVLCEDDAARTSHQELFSNQGAAYETAEQDILESIMSAGRRGFSRLHIAGGWQFILRVALWTGRQPLLHDVMLLLRKAGVSREALGPFEKSDINDLFPWLYYQRQFDVLRRICGAAKTQAESRSGSRYGKVHCHLVSREDKRVVASSL